MKLTPLVIFLIMLAGSLQASELSSYKSTKTAVVSNSSPVELQPAKAGKVTGRLTDRSSGEPIPLANVVILSPADSSLVTGQSADMQGKFTVKVPYGSYLFKVQVIGYRPYYTNISLSKNQGSVNLGEIKIRPGSKNLNEVEVSAEKSQVQIDGDKTIFNVNKDITTAGGTAQDAFKNLPSVTIDQDGDVSMRGNSNVRIFVNGRETSYQGLDDAALLKQIPAGSIEKIEVITNPSSRYSAAGSAGIINIVLKRNNRSGLSGMVNLTGALPDDHNLNTNLRYNTGNWRFEGGYNFQYEERESRYDVLRTTAVQDSVGYLDQHETSDKTEREHNFNGGIEFRPTDQDLIYLEGRGSIEEEVSGGSIDYTYQDENRLPTRAFMRNTNERENDWRVNYTLGYNRKYEDSDEKLTGEFSYMLNSENTRQQNEQFYEMVLPGDTLPAPTREKQLADEFRKTYVGKVDYVHPFNDNFKGEIGAKSNIRFIRTGNAFYNFDDGSGIFANVDSLRNIFEYDEMVNAGYVSGTYNLDKWSFQGGVRAEQTQVTSDLVTTENEYDKDYLNLFPSAFISYKPSHKQEMRVGLTRRIDRPRFWQLNPFPTYEDPLNVRKGNPELDPELTWSASGTYIKRWNGLMFNATLYYRVTDDVIKRYRKIDENGVAISTRENLAKEYSKGGEIFVNQEVNDWWKYNISANLSYERLEVKEGQQAQNTRSLSFRARTSQTFTLPLDLTLQFNVFYLPPRKTVQGKFDGFSFVEGALKRDFLDDKLSVTFRVSDILNDRKFTIHSVQNNATLDATYQRTSRRFFLSLTYNFNNYEKNRSHGQQDSGGQSEGQGGF